MRKKVRNWTAFLLALVLILGSMPLAYAAGYSITVNAPTGNDLPYWVFEKVGVDSADVLNLTANEGHTLPAGKVARVSLAVGKNKEDEAACGISINGMYYVQSVTLDHPDFFTGTVVRENPIIVWSIVAVVAALIIVGAVRRYHKVKRDERDDVASKK